MYTFVSIVLFCAHSFLLSLKARRLFRERMTEKIKELKSVVLFFAVTEGGSLIHDDVVRELLASVCGRMKELLTSHIHNLCRTESPICA